MGKKYTKEFLISELQRFVSENGKNPRFSNMQSKFGYPSNNSYARQFGTWNNALIAAGLEINQYQDHWQDGSETCDNCGKTNDGYRWQYKNNQRLCEKCRHGAKYRFNNLSPDSSVGFGFIGQRVVAKTLGLKLKYDCNCSEGFMSEYDLYDNNKYKYINVKAGILNTYNRWQFIFNNKYKPDTYIMLGFSNDKSNIEHVWITEPEDDLTFDEKNFKYKQSISIKNDINNGLNRARTWEVNVKPYNDTYHNMSLENCSVLRSD